MLISRKWLVPVLISFIVGGIGIAFFWHFAPTVLSYIVGRAFAPCSVGLQTLVTAEIQYQADFPKRGYSHNLAELGPKDSMGCTAPSESAACLIDFALAQATDPATSKSGYVYSYTPGPPNTQGVVESFTIRSDPAKKEFGTNHFYVDETAVMRMEKNKPAGKESPIIKSACDW